MSLSYNYAGGYNTFIPNVDASAQGGLMVEFSRAPDRFRLNQYTQLQQVELESGKYWRFDQDAMARINTGDGSQFIWADGADRPAQNIWQGFEFPSYNCTRLNFGFHLGDLAKYHAQKAAGVDLTAVNSRTVAGAAMVQRTRKALTRMLDTSVLSSYDFGAGTGTGTYPSGLAGNKWNAGDNLTAGHAYFRIYVNNILAQIVQLSNGQVQPKDINLIMGPDTAIGLGASLEVLDYVKQSPFALPSLLQDATFGQYGLPSTVFGASKIIVEDASYISAHPMSTTAAATRSWVIPKGTVIFASRPGGIEGSPQSYSTCMGFFLEEMSVEVFDSPQHRYVAGNVVDNYDYQITAPITGFIAKNVI
jgi:hypothetical protein